jgi:hypothetical protein
MPFYGHIGIPDPATQTTFENKYVSGTICDWSVSEGTFTKPEQRIGTVDIGGRRYGLIICFPALIEKLYTTAGSAVADDDFILKWMADGDSIPYGRAYFRLEARSCWRRLSLEFS